MKSFPNFFDEVKMTAGGLDLHTLEILTKRENINIIESKKYLNCIILLVVREVFVGYEKILDTGINHY